jgi:zinc transporter
MTPNESPFVHAVELDGRGGGRPIEPAMVDSALDGDNIVWLHLDLNISAARTWISERSDIDSLIEDALLANETRPRAVSLDRGLLLVLRGVNMNPDADPDDMVAVRLWVESGRIVSVRRRRIFSVQDVRDAINAGEGPRTVGEFVVTLVGFIAERIGVIVDSIEDLVEKAESDAPNAASTALRTEVGAIRRRTAAIRRYLAPQRDALDRLYRNPGPLFSRYEEEALREQADRITRYLEDLELVRERAIVLQEELMNRIAQEQNSRIYLLSIIAAIFLPLTFVTGLLGMNVAGLPGTEDPSAFGLSLIVMAALGVGLALFFKWRSWL